MRKEKGEGGEKELPITNVIENRFSSPVTSRKKRTIKRSNNLSKFTSNDYKEMNEVSKRGRGLSALSLREILGEENY